MQVQKPSIPKGTRDFQPVEMAKRNYIFQTIREVFHLYGFEQIETPAMENLSTLMGKYGEEGDKLLFKILNSGDFMAGISFSAQDNQLSQKLASAICEKGLRYDLTVPFARFVVQYQNQLVFPFRRYQIQPVWRADRPQKGRYREFYQCDADIIGSKSLVSEAELVYIIDEVFKRLGLKVLLKINNRKILAGIAEVSGCSDKLTDITTAIDKLDKIGIEKVQEELISRGLTEDNIRAINPLFNITGTMEERMSQIEAYIHQSAIGVAGIQEIKEMLALIDRDTLSMDIELDITLARGLNYYTGMIFEVKSLDTQIGSISGGGRYDDLTGIFGLKDMSGVGISFGAERIFDVLEQLQLFPDTVNSKVKVMFVNFGNREQKYALDLVVMLRRAGIPCEIYPEAAKMKKQMSYADAKQVPFVAFTGEEELKESTVSIKNMITGEQKTVKAENLVSEIIE